MLNYEKEHTKMACFLLYNIIKNQNKGVWKMLTEKRVEELEKFATDIRIQTIRQM